MTQEKSYNNSSITKNRKNIVKLLKKMDEIDRKIYLMNESVAGIKQELKHLKELR